MENRLTRTPLRRTTTAFAPTALLLVLAVLIAIGFGKIRATHKDVGRAREAALAAERVFSDMKDAESGNRGFLIVGNDRYLAPYFAALTQLTADTQALRRLVASDTVQRARLDSLAVLVDARLALLARGINLRRAGEAEAAADVVRSGSGIRHMQHIRGVMTDIINHERDHAEASVAAEARYVRALALLFVVGTVLATALGYLVNLALLRFAAGREAAAREIRAQHDLLQEQAVELEVQRDHLQDQNLELEVQQDQLQKQAVEMEMQQDELQVRAAVLEELNRDLESARVEAEQANRAKSQFLAAMSHELRTPLNAIGGYVDLVQANVYGGINDKQRDALERVKSNQQHLLAIISDIMSYARMAAGTLEVRTQNVAVQPLVAEIEQIMHPVVREKNLILVIDPSIQEPVVVNADPARIRQILVNLMTNAAKFTPAGGRVALSCSAADDVVGLAVSDTGTGIAPDKLDAIFEPFVQLDRSDHEPGGRGGLGLGLAISRELARGMGGDVVVESTVGVGSVFTLRVPRSVAAAVAAPLSAEPV
jgi:signal transduction histidine kinase